MKIAVVSLMSGECWGGSEVLWSKTVDMAIKTGHSVFISIYKWDVTPKEVTQLIKKGATIDFRARYDAGSFSFLKKLRTYLINKILKNDNDYKKIWDFRPDHIIINQGSSFDIAVHHYNLYENIIKRKIRYSIICHGHPQFSFIPNESIYPRAKRVFLNAKNVFIISETQKNIIEKALCCKLDNTELTWNPLNLNKYEYVRWLDRNVTQFAIVGGLVSGKGQDVIIEILSHKKWMERKWHLNIYGRGYGKGYLQDLIVWYNLQGRVTFHGHVDDIADIWKKNHILLSSSSGEGLPISLCEAMVCGRPSVVTDVGGHKALIKEGKTGFIAEAPSLYSFESALERAWINKMNWEKIGLNANQLAKELIVEKPEKLLLHSILGS